MNVKLSNSQLNKLKLAIENEAGVVFKTGNSNDENSFPHKLLITNRQASNLRKTFPGHTSTDIKLSIAELSKMMQLGGFLGRLLGSLLRTGLPLFKNVIQPLAKSFLIPLRLTAAAAAADAGIQKKSLRIWS